jgi:hypothetical protein
MSERKRVIFANDCDPCPDCSEPVCPVCSIHYADCGCPGPFCAVDGDEGWTLFEENGVWWGVRTNGAAA